MENTEHMKKVNNLLDEISQAHMQLSAVCQAMDLALNDMYQCLKMPNEFMETIRADKIVLQQQRNVVYDVLKRFEQIAPDVCRTELF